jgi:hypothetical protein
MSEPSFDHKNYIFSAIYVPDDHSPSLASQDSWNNFNVCTFGKSFGLIARSQETDVPILSIYGIEALDFNQTLSLVITNIVFGHNTCPDYELEDTDFVLTHLFKYMIGCLGMSTDAPIVFIDERDMKAVSYLPSYNAHHIYPTDIIREWFRETTTKSLFAELDADMNAKIKATHPNYLYRLVSQSFNYSFLMKWMNIGWKGPFYLDLDDDPVDRTVSIDLQKHPGLLGEDETLFKVWRYSQVNYMGLEKWFKSESYGVKFCAAEEEDKCKGSIPVSISLTEEQIAYIAKVSAKGNRSKYIQTLIDADMECHQLSVKAKSDQTNPSLRTTIASSGDGWNREGNMKIPPKAVTDYLTDNYPIPCARFTICLGSSENPLGWSTLIDHVTKVEEVERPFLGSAQDYTCLELTIQETPSVNPIAMLLTGGLVIGVKLKKPYAASEEPKLIAYRCVTFPSETRRNAMKYYDPTTNVTSTIRLLIMGKGFVSNLGAVAPPKIPAAQTRDEMMEKLREELFQNPTCCGMVMRGSPD